MTNYDPDPWFDYLFWSQHFRPVPNRKDWFHVEFHYEPESDEKSEFNKYMSYTQFKPDTEHPLYKQYHYLLSWKFKNDINVVKTAYLDTFDKKFNDKSRSEDQHYYYYIYDRIITQFYRHNIDIVYKKLYHDKIEKHFRQFVIKACEYYMAQYADNSTGRRDQVKWLFNRIFGEFNKTLDEIDKKYIFDVKPRSISLPVYSNQSHQLPPVNHRRRGRPRKEHIQIYHPDLYGFP